MKKARTLVINIFHNMVYEQEIDSLEGFYEALSDGDEVDCFDIAHIDIGGKVFDLYVDDIGLFRDNPVPSCVDEEEMPLLFGNIVIANHDSEGNTTSLSDKDIALIWEHIGTGFCPEFSNGFPILYNCKYPSR